MKPRPIRMPDGLWDELQEEADENGMGTAEYVRSILRDRQEITQSNTQPNTSVIERLNELETRVETLESDTLSDTLPDTEADTLPDTQRLEEIVAEFDIPGRAYATQDARRGVAREQLAWLRERGEVSAGDVQHEFADEDVLNRSEYQDGESYWEHFGRDVVFKQAAENSIVESGDGTYTWSG